jgi:DNA replication protein DnaD
MLFLKKESLLNWKNKELELQNIQCNPKLYLNSDFNDLEISYILGYIANLMQRIDKYSERYDLTFNENSKKMLKPFKNYILQLNSNKKHQDKKIYFTANTYYASANKTISYTIYINRFFNLLDIPLSFSILKSKNDLYYYFDLRNERNKDENILFE